MALSDDTEYGVTSTGFVRMRLPEIRENMFAQLESKLGTEVSRLPNSLIGILMNIYAEEIDRQWQLAEQDYYDRSPVSAGEGSIDNTLSYTMVTRKKASSSYLYAVCYGQNATVLSSNSQIQGDDDEVWNIYQSSIITLENCVTLICSVETVTEGDNYGFIINGNNFFVTADAEDNVNNIYSNLVTLINNYENKWGSSESPWSASITDEGVVISQTNRRYGVNVSATSTINIIEVGTPIIFVAKNTGELDPDIGTITTINTNKTGWDSVCNESSAYVGRDDETLNEVRLRYASAVYHKSIGMCESIKAALEELDDVTNVIIYENRTDYTDSRGLKPHSFEVVIRGGDDMDIANTILAVAPVGIDTNGTTTKKVTDSNGTIEEISFSRPKKITIFVDIQLHLYDEEDFAGDTQETIQDVIVEYGNNLGVGVDIIPQRFMGTIFENTTGIAYMDIKISKDDVDSEGNEIAWDDKEWVTTPIAIAMDEIALFSTDNVVVKLPDE